MLLQTKFNGFQWAKLECEVVFFSQWKLRGTKSFFFDLETINPNPNQRSDVMEIMQFIMYISTCFSTSAIDCFFIFFFFSAKRTLCALWFLRVQTNRLQSPMYSYCLCWQERPLSNLQDKFSPSCYVSVIMC